MTTVKITGALMAEVTAALEQIIAECQATLNQLMAVEFDGSEASLDVNLEDTDLMTIENYTGIEL
jgi:hypothetical protein